MTYLKLSVGDITASQADAIVNAANTQLRPGTGVDGAIHKAAGPELAVACAQIGGCKTGQAVITPAFRLKAKFVIHTPSPVVEQDDAHALLESCYASALNLAHMHGIKTIAFPAIGGGFGGGFTLEESATAAKNAIESFSAKHPNALGVITMILFRSAHKEVFLKILRGIKSKTVICN